MSSADPDFQLALASIHLTSVDTEITDKQLSEKISGVIDEFRYLIHAHTLTAHDVGWSLRPTVKGTDLLFYLRRRLQVALRLTHAGSKGIDIYDDEIRLVAEYLDLLPDRFQRAFKSSVNPQQDTEVRTMRQYVRHHPKLKMLRELVESPADFSLRGPTNDVAPHSRQLKVQFVVVGITRQMVRIKSLSEATSGLPPAALSDLRPRVRLYRHKEALGIVSGAEFSWSLETGEALEAVVSIEYAYSSGQVKRLSLQSRPSRVLVHSAKQ